MSLNKIKPQVFIEQGNTLFGYVYPIVYNETIRTNSNSPAFNQDADPLTKNLHSKEAMEFATNSLGDDI